MDEPAVRYQRARQSQGDDAVPTNPEPCTSRPWCQHHTGPADVPTSPGGVRTLWASWVRSAEPAPFPCPSGNGGVQPRCHLSERPPPVSQVCPGRGLDPRPRGPGLSTGPRECSSSPALCLRGTRFIEGEEGGSQSEARPRLRSRALRPRRGAAVQASNDPCPSLRPSTVHPVTAPVREAGAAPARVWLQRFTELRLDSSRAEGQAREAHGVQTGPPHEDTGCDVGEGVTRGMEAGGLQTAPCGLSHLGTRRGWAGQVGVALEPQP